MPDTNLPPWRVSAEPTAEELHGRKVDRLIQAAREIKEAQDFEKSVVNMMRRSDSPYDEGHAAISYVVDGPDGTPKVHRHYLAKAPPHVKALLAATPRLLTGLRWTNMAFEGRIEYLTSAKLAPDLALVDDVCELFPDDTDQYLLDWQLLVNSGTAFNVGANVGSQADELLKAGYLLHPPQAVTCNFCKVPGRHDTPAGEPGSPVFVRSMMGENYLAWIEAVR